MIPADSDDIMQEYDMLIEELRAFNEELLLKKMLLAITKSDLLDQELKDEILDSLDLDIPVLFISSISSEGIMEIKDKLWAQLNA